MKRDAPCSACGDLDGCHRWRSALRGEPAAGQRWRHFKGTTYEIVGLAKHSETTEDLILYRAEAAEIETVWARPASMWEDPIERGAYKGPRFTRIADVG